ncbi:mitogen-activated protein kinase kinase kinase 5 [Vigna unguiculata]|uniref:mitogen-activated protein kinase kinase kinase n=1 Tax=Vigna unguiculata TaxID=3917 RepID=A0A4D6KY43_VIGUN|nr:mitogen-activated protein kinase kinase kinase 5 [Vigna unguiculata]QCD81663.1 mitogen-activated protein kinase kinase kinase [Vigna unguiculata]
MRWLSTLSFTHSCSSSSSSAAAADHRRKAWLFGSSSKKRACHGENDARWHEDDSPFSSPGTPQPLPLPELASSSALIRNRDGKCRLPSPKEAATATTYTGCRMRSAFAGQDTRRSMEQAETRSSRMVHQDACGCCESARDNSNTNNSNLASIPRRSSFSSIPFASPSILSPKKTKNGESVPYYYASPRGNQFWSAPEMSTCETGLPPPAFFDLSVLSTEASPSPTSHPSPQRRSPGHHTKTLSGPLSPIHSKLSLEISMVRRESTAPPVSVHPLPLPPGAPLPSPSSASTFSNARAESLPMKNQWQKGKLIGRGTFGSVYVATNRETGALCAMKEVEMFPDDPKSAECIKQLEQEIKVLSHLQHSNIVQYFGSETVEGRFYIYLEYVHPGSINKYVREHCGAITESVIRNFTRHILSGLAYLHSKKTIHRDIKGANLLVDSAGVVKLADFGMAKHLNGFEANLSLRGSPYWMAPELLQAVMQKDNNPDLAFAIDIWSLGCTIIEMFTGKPPWSEYEGAAALFKVMKETPPIPETLSPEGKDFLRCCFKRNPAERPAAAVLLEHRFLKNSQQLDVSSPTQLYNGTGFMDKPRSPIKQFEYKHDQLSISCAKIAKVKAADRRGFRISSLEILPASFNQ